MQSPGGPYQAPYGGQYAGPYAAGYPQQPRPHPRRWLFIGLAVMLGLIGVAVLLVILTPATFGYHPTTGIGPFGLFGGFLLIFFFVWIILWIARIGMWSSRSRGYNQPGGRGRRYGAFAIARERYARGEITREQYDQIMQDLQRRPGYPPPP
jgi:putative membrane protein